MFRPVSRQFHQPIPPARAQQLFETAGLGMANGRQLGRGRPGWAAAMPSRSSRYPACPTMQRWLTSDSISWPGRQSKSRVLRKLSPLTSISSAGPSDNPHVGGNGSPVPNNPISPRRFLRFEHRRVWGLGSSKTGSGPLPSAGGAAFGWWAGFSCTHQQGPPWLARRWNRRQIERSGIFSSSLMRSAHDLQPAIHSPQLAFSSRSASCG